LLGGECAGDGEEKKGILESNLEIFKIIGENLVPLVEAGNHVHIRLKNTGKN
jgi:hypothetical protein